MPLLEPVTITFRPVMAGMSCVEKVVMDNNVGADNNVVKSNFASLVCPRMTTDHAQRPTERPYHHGNLRAALLSQAERTVRERGVQDLSLRELAREVGVSHGATRRHFPYRQPLLDALAQAGFERLGSELRGAFAGADDDFESRLRATAAAYVRFATR